MILYKYIRIIDKNMNIIFGNNKKEDILNNNLILVKYLIGGNIGIVELFNCVKPYDRTRSIKVSEDIHLQTKLAAASVGMSMQMFVELSLKVYLGRIKPVPATPHHAPITPLKPKK